jgi:hypothetical protein
MFTSCPALMTGGGLTKTVTVSIAEHPLRNPVTEYKVVVVGLAVGDWQVRQLSEGDAVHE